MPQTANPAFCSHCGAQLNAVDQFCAGCGHPSAGGDSSAASEQPPAVSPAPAPTSANVASSGSVAAAAAVFVLFACAGIGSYYYATNKPAAIQRAVSGAGGGGAPPQGLPSKHPSLELPPDVIKFIDDLAATAEAAPEDVEAWSVLTRARYRAGLLNPTYKPAAEQSLAHLLELDADNLEGLRIAGNIAYDRRDFQTAEGHFERYLTLNPGDPGLLTDLGSTLLFQDRPEEALTKYAQALTLDPDFLQAHFNQGIALHGQGKTDEALKAFRSARKLTTDPQQGWRIDVAIAEAEGKPPPPPPAALAAPPNGFASGGIASGGATSGAAAPGAGSVGPVTSNASEPFQEQADKLFTGHRIVGPRVARIEWTGNSTARVYLSNFPMDQMPPVVRNKFKSTVNGQLVKLAGQHGITGPIEIELIDSASERVMDRLDAKEWVGAFDEVQYE